MKIVNNHFFFGPDLAFVTGFAFAFFEAASPLVGLTSGTSCRWHEKDTFYTPVTPFLIEKKPTVANKYNYLYTF
jgi:hypothetical protein